MGMIENWKSVLMQPKETFAKRKSEANLQAAMKPYAIIGALAGFLVGVALMGVGVLLASAVPSLAPFVGLGVLLLPLGIIGGAIMAVLGSLIGSGIAFVFAKLLGGTGEFKTQYFLQSLFVVPVAILSIFSVIPLLGQIIGLLLGIYNIYLTILVYKEAHGFSTLKAFLVWLLPILLVIVIVVVLFGALFAAIFAAAATAKGA